MRSLRHIGFICGCGHSGTTLLATILSAHSDIYLPLVERAVFFREKKAILTELNCLSQKALDSGKKVLLEKTPSHVRKITKIRKLVPEARFIMMVRDGRDVTVSLAHRFYGDYTLGIKRWVADNTFVAKEVGKHDTLLLRYEDLVVNPSNEIRRVCNFLDLPYSDKLLEYYKIPRLWYGRTNVVPASGQGFAHEDFRNWQVNQPIFDGRGRWRRELPPYMLQKFERGKARKLMHTFDYVETESQKFGKGSIDYKTDARTLKTMPSGSRKKIAFIVTEFPSITETFILRQITGLLERGCEVDIFAYSKGVPGLWHEEIGKYNLQERTYYLPARTFSKFRIARGIKRIGLLAISSVKKSNYRIKDTQRFQIWSESIFVTSRSRSYSVPKQRSIRYYSLPIWSQWKTRPSS